MGSRTVDVGLFSYSLDAYQAQAWLEENGIVATVTGVQAGTLWGAPGLEAVRVAVLEQDAERATTLLAEMPKGGGASPDEPEEEDEPEESEVPEEPDEPRDDESGMSEEEVAPSRAREIPETDDEQWARRTRAIAMVGLGVWILLFAAILRLTSARARGELTPLARTYIRHARIAVGAGIVLMGAFLLIFLKLGT